MNRSVQAKLLMLVVLGRVGISHVIDIDDRSTCGHGEEHAPVVIIHNVSTPVRPADALVMQLAWRGLVDAPGFEYRAVVTTLLFRGDQVVVRNETALDLKAGEVEAGHVYVELAWTDPSPEVGDRLDVWIEIYDLFPNLQPEHSMLAALSGKYMVDHLAAANASNAPRLWRKETHDDIDLKMPVYAAADDASDTAEQEKKMAGGGVHDGQEVLKTSSILVVYSYYETERAKHNFAFFLEQTLKYDKLVAARTLSIHYLIVINGMKCSVYFLTDRDRKRDRR